LSPLVQGQHDGVSCLHSGNDIAQSDPEPRRRSIGLPTRVHQSTHRLSHNVVCRPFTVGTQVAVQAAKSRNTSVNEAWIQFRKRLVANTHFFKKAGPKFFDDAIRLASKPPKNLPPPTPLGMKVKPRLVAFETEKITALRLAF